MKKTDRTFFFSQYSETPLLKLCSFLVLFRLWIFIYKQKITFVKEQPNFYTSALYNSGWGWVSQTWPLILVFFINRLQPHFWGLFAEDLMFLFQILCYSLDGGWVCCWKSNVNLAKYRKIVFPLHIFFYKQPNC